MSKDFNLIILTSEEGQLTEALVHSAQAYKVKAIICGAELSQLADNLKDSRIPIIVLLPKDFASRQEHKRAMFEASLHFGPDLVCLADFGQMIEQKFIEFHRQQVVNLHPSLLPNFRVKDPHVKAAQLGVQEHGCTAYFVDPWLASGPIVAQAQFRCETKLSPRELLERVNLQAKTLYPWVVNNIAAGHIRREDEIVRFSDEAKTQAKQNGYLLPFS